MMPASRLPSVLLWLERVLLAAGVALGGWSLASYLEARFYAQLPPPAAAGVRSLPGDRGTSPAARAALEHGAWVGRLEAPRIGLAATVLEGSDDWVLARAAGHIEGTARPGDGSNVGIAGHRDTVFRPVRHLVPGDHLRLTTRDGLLDYRVVSTAIVDPLDVHVLDPTARPTLTLVTCYPFTYIGNAPKRFIVRAELVAEGPGGSSGKERQP